MRSGVKRREAEIEKLSDNERDSKRWRSPVIIEGEIQRSRKTEREVEDKNIKFL